MALAQLVPGARHMVGEEFARHLNVDARAVAGLAVGVDRAAMPHRLQRADRRFDHFAARDAVDRGDEADAAGVVLVRRIVGMVRLKAVAFRAIAGDLGLGGVAGVGHCGSGAGLRWQTA